MDFKTWINEKYIDWRGKTRNTVSEFALWLNIPQSVVSKWLNGKMIPREPENIARLARRFGREVYDILGYYIPQSFNGLVYWSTADGLSPEQRQDAWKRADEAVRPIEDETRKMQTFEELLSEYGVKIFKVQLSFPLVKIDDPDLAEILEIYAQLTTDERLDYVKWGKQKLLEAKSHNSNRDRNHSQNPA